jgi:membrane-bound lytic murein transglycosylase D
MKYTFFLLFIFLSFSGFNQDFAISRIQPIIKAHQNYETAFPNTLNANEKNCPPQLSNTPISSFAFLDSLPLNPQLEEEFLSLFLNDNCNKFYSFLNTFQYGLPQYKKALNENGLNEKYTLLPLTVSGGNPTLKYLKDKSGVWQLSYVTARKYGLQINSFIDERNDIQKSSIAAARHIKFLNEYYLNNEFLVITAFYTSVPFVNKHIAQLDTVNPITFFESLPPEIQGYFSYLKAWTNWLTHFKTPISGISGDTTEYWTEVISKDTLNFTTISQFMEIPMDQLKMMNPILIGEKALPKSQHPLLLPKEKASIFDEKHDAFLAFQKEEEIRKKKELAALKKKMESGIPDLNKYKAVTYTVKSGDVLGKIAQKNHVKVSQIKQWNHLKSDRISIGQKLVLYVRKNQSTTLPKETADNKIKVKPSPAKPGSGKPQIYTVKNGESLWLISQKFPGVSAENIMEWNGCTDKISPGMQLKIYTP